MNHLKLSEQEVKFLLSYCATIIADPDDYEYKIANKIYDKLKAVLD